MPMTTVGPWYCDTCDELISVAEKGQAIWRRGIDEPPHDFRIVHIGRGCDDRRHPSSMHLQEFVGVDGLIYLTSFLSVGPIMTTLQGKPERPMIEDLDGFVDFLRRVQIPGYEAARRRFSDDSVLEAHSDGTESSPYRASSLRRIINRDE